MTTRFFIKAPLASNTHVNLDDAIKTKIALQRLGYYKAPGYGMTPYPDAQLFDAVSNLQRDKGMRATGEVRPGDDTEKAIRTALGTNSSGASTRAENEGKYIWRTRGDNKVRSEHAERDGKVFEWNNPPEDGHPGEAPNCRCRAEDLDANDSICKKLAIDIQRKIIDVETFRIELRSFRENYLNHAQDFTDAESDLLSKITEAAIPDIPDDVSDIRAWLRAALSTAGKLFMLEVIASAWDGRRAARNAMEIARKSYEDSQRRLTDARMELSNLERKHRAKCN